MLNGCVEALFLPPSAFRISLTVSCTSERSRWVDALPKQCQDRTLGHGRLKLREDGRHEDLGVGAKLVHLLP
jgi:hypothetical protein